MRILSILITSGDTGKLVILVTNSLPRITLLSRCGILGLFCKTPISVFEQITNLEVLLCRFPLRIKMGLVRRH